MEIHKFLTKVNFDVAKNKVNKYIVVHFTANDGDTAKGNCQYFYDVYRGASANYFVDSKSIYQCVLDKDIAWHCGASRYKHKECRNFNSIGVEMCSRKNKAGQYYIEKKTLENTIYLVKMLMEKYNIKIENVLRHFDVTGKRCPSMFVDEKAWSEFKAKLVEEVKKEEESEVVSEGKAIVNGKEYKIDRILKDGVNYIKVANFSNMGFDVGYNESTKAITIDNKVEKAKVNGKDVSSIKIRNTNFLKVRELAKVLGLEVKYENGEIFIE